MATSSQNNNNNNNEWHTTFQEIKNKHNEAYKTIEIAIRCEEREEVELAHLHYKIGIALIDEALTIPVAIPDDPNDMDDTWNDACKMIHKMKRTRAEILQRIGSITIELCRQKKMNDIYDNTGSTTTANGESSSGNNINNKVTDDNGIPNCRPRTYTELAHALENMSNTIANNSIATGDNLIIDQLDLIFSCDDVKFYNISANGGVCTTDELFTLRIVSIAEDNVKHLQKTYFLQLIKSSAAIKINKIETLATSQSTSSSSSFPSSDIANMNALQQHQSDTDTDHNNLWIYPLIPGASPCYRTDYGAFIFPDLQNEEHGSAIGIVAPTGPDEILLEILDSLLHGVVRHSDIIDDEKPKALSETVSNNIVRGACYISNGLVKGSEKFGELITYSTPYIMSKLGQAPQDMAPVSSSITNTVGIAKSATTVALNVSGYVVGKVSTATVALGRFLAPHIQTQGSRLLSHTMGISEQEAIEKVNGVFTIAAGAVEGFGTVYAGLEQSASILGNNLSNNSVKIIEHKYGPSAGTVASNTFDVVGNVINIRKNVTYMTPKGFTKRSAKETGKAFIQDYKAQGKNYIPAGALYPDLSEFAKEVSKKQT